MIRYLQVVLICIQISLPLFSQTDYSSVLRKGSIIPGFDVFITYDQVTRKVNIKEFKGKSLLLDFWGVHCVPCINGLPKLLELQSKFGDRIQIILVTNDSKEEVDNLWNRLLKNEVTRNWVSIGKKLPIVYNDTTLFSLFQCEGQPTHAWIDKDQRLVALTKGASTNEENLTKFLSGNNTELVDEQILFSSDKNNPIAWIRENSFIEQFIPYYSFLITSISLGPSQTGIPNDHQPRRVVYLTDSTHEDTIGIFCNAGSIIGLYRVAYAKNFGEYKLVPFNRIVVEAERTNRFFPEKNTDFIEWAKQNMFSYALKLPLIQAKYINETMIRNLDSFLQVESHVKTIKVPCLILKRTPDDSKPLYSSYKGPQKHGISNDSSFLILENVGLDMLRHYVADLFFSNDPGLRFFDETGYMGKVNMRLRIKRPYSKNTLVLLDEDLRRYGFSLVTEERSVKMLVLKDRSSPKANP